MTLHSYLQFSVHITHKPVYYNGSAINQMRTHSLSTTFYSTQIQDRCTTYDDQYENVHMQNVLLPSCLFHRFPACISYSLFHHITDSVLSVSSVSEASGSSSCPQPDVSQICLPACLPAHQATTAPLSSLK